MKKHEKDSFRKALVKMAEAEKELLKLLNCEEDDDEDEDEDLNYFFKEEEEVDYLAELEGLYPNADLEEMNEELMDWIDKPW
jgi:hypothetical protein